MLAISFSRASYTPELACLSSQGNYPARRQTNRGHDLGDTVYRWRRGLAPVAPRGQRYRSDRDMTRGSFRA